MHISIISFGGFNLVCGIQQPSIFTIKVLAFEKTFTESSVMRLHCWSSETSFWLKFGLTETWKGCLIALKLWR